MSRNVYSEIANILEEFVQEKKSLDVSLENLWAYESCKENLVKEVLHFFRHYYDDEDIRKKDVDYADYQNQRLRKYVIALKEKSQHQNSGPDLDF